MLVVVKTLKFVFTFEVNFFYQRYSLHFKGAVCNICTTYSNVQTCAYLGLVPFKQYEFTSPIFRPFYWHQGKICVENIPLYFFEKLALLTGTNLGPVS